MKGLCLSLLSSLLLQTVFALNPAHFTINRITAPYFIVDANSPATLTTAYLGIEVINNSGSAVTYSNLSLQIDSIRSSVAGQNYAVLSPVSAKKIIGTLAPGESRVCYFYVSYPASVTPTGTFYVQLTDGTGTGKSQSIAIYNRSSISANAGGAATQVITNQDLLGGIFTDDVTYKVGNVQNNNEVDFQISVSTLFDPAKMTLISTSVLASSIPGVPIGATDSLYYRTGNGSSGDTVKVRWTFKITGYNFTNYLLPCAGATSGSSNYKYTLNTSLGANGTPVTISAAANPLTISKRSDKTLYLVDSIAHFTITVKNGGLYGISIDSITDQLPAGFTFLALEAGSYITSSNSFSLPGLGSSGNVRFASAITSNGTAAYFIPAGDSIQLKYTALAPSVGALNLLSTAGGYVGAVQFANSPNVISVSATLPVLWLSFTAERTQNAVRLNWVTAREQNILDYTIQRSSNGTVWQNISSIPSQSGSGSRSAYQYTDAGATAEICYYRIWQRDLDGHGMYSEIRVVGKAGQHPTFQLPYGNRMVGGRLLMYLSQSSTLFLYNNMGALLYKQNYSAGTHSLNCGPLAAGVYYIRVGSEMQKMVVE